MAPRHLAVTVAALVYLTVQIAALVLVARLAGPAL
jgi:hypothetical protein